MIPMIAQIHVRHAHGRLRLWIPLFLVWLLLLPFALVALPVAAIALRLRGIDPWRAVAVLGSLACALTGTLVEVDSPEATVLVRIL